MKSRTSSREISGNGRPFKRDFTGGNPSMRKIFILAVALVLWAGLIALPAAAQTQPPPDWYGHGHRVSFSGDVLARILSGGATSSTYPLLGLRCRV
jgi:hypothetical protein